MICIGCKYYDAEHTTCRNIKARYVGCDECFKWEKKKSTNADRIRSMSDEELAEWLVSIIECDDGCPCIKECGEKEEMGFCLVRPYSSKGLLVSFFISKILLHQTVK